MKKEKLYSANYLTDISLRLWNKLLFPPDIRKELNRRRQEDIKLGYYMYPLGNDFDRFIDYESVEISVENSNKVLRATGSNDRLTNEQRAIIKLAGYGSDIVIKINFKFKSQNGETNDGKVYQGTLTVTVLPAVEAGFPDGNEPFTKYVNSVITDRLSNNSRELIRWAVVRFTVNENGKVVDVSLYNTSTDRTVDRLIIDGFKSMPDWKPAVDARGKNVREEFTIPLGRVKNAADGC